MKNKKEIVRSGFVVSFVRSKEKVRRFYTVPSIFCRDVNLTGGDLDRAIIFQSREDAKRVADFCCVVCNDVRVDEIRELTDRKNNNPRNIRKPSNCIKALVPVRSSFSDEDICTAKVYINNRTGEILFDERSAISILWQVLYRSFMTTDQKSSPSIRKTIRKAQDYMEEYRRGRQDMDSVFVHAKEYKHIVSGFCEIIRRSGLWNSDGIDTLRDFMKRIDSMCHKVWKRIDESRNNDGSNKPDKSDRHVIHS